MTALANSYLVEYCNSDVNDKGGHGFGTTGGRGGFLSQLDSQQLLTYDNMTAPGSYSDMDMMTNCIASTGLLRRRSGANSLPTAFSRPRSSSATILGT